MISPWNPEDLKNLALLDELITKKASWNLTTPEAISLYKTLVWIASLKKKIQDSQVEIVSIKEVNKEEAPKVKKAKS